MKQQVTSGDEERNPTDEKAELISEVRRLLSFSFVSKVHNFQSGRAGGKEGSQEGGAATPVNPKCQPHFGFRSTSQIVIMIRYDISLNKIKFSMTQTSRWQRRSRRRSNNSSEPNISLTFTLARMRTYIVPNQSFCRNSK